MRLGWLVGTTALVVVAAASGYFYLKSASFHFNASSPSPAPTKTSVFSSIKDALAKHISLKCDYIDNKEIHTVAYIKNGLIRSTVTNKKEPSQSGNMIIQDKKMYYWNDAGTIAFVMTMPDVTGIMPSVTPTQNNPQEAMSNLEKYKQSCVAAAVDDSLFVLPKGVTFQDMTQMMQKTPTGVPTGTSSGNYQQQMQQYMQQYKTASQ